jgi:predicted ArsR family transcriptional regulator
VNPLIDPCENKHGGNAESIAAHDTVISSKAALQQRILDYIEARGSATCDEVEVDLGILLQTASGRMAELKAAGLIVATGERRPTRTGRKAGVYKVRPRLTTDNNGQGLMFGGRS